jgi:hypothetical protein
MQGFKEEIIGAIDVGKIVCIKVGTMPHRFIGIWAVVVEGRVCVRSWSLKPRSWYRTFLEDPGGVIQIGAREIQVRAVRTRSERLKDAVDRAYLQKYGSPGSIRFARDLGSEKYRASTIELVPLPPAL